MTGQERTRAEDVSTWLRLPIGATVTPLTPAKESQDAPVTELSVLSAPLIRQIDTALDLLLRTASYAELTIVIKEGRIRFIERVSEKAITE